MYLIKMSAITWTLIIIISSWIKDVLIINFLSDLLLVLGVFGELSFGVKGTVFTDNGQ